MRVIKLYWVSTIVVTILAAGYLLIHRLDFFVDESAHFRIINAIAENKITLKTFNVAQLPGYHYFVGYIAKLFNAHSLSDIRLINVFISFITVVVFYKVRHHVELISASPVAMGNRKEILKPSFAQGFGRAQRVQDDKLPGQDDSRATAFLKTLQFLFLPILFPFFFLVYTDALSLLLILITLYFFLGNKTIPGNFFGLLSIFVRQNNIVWLIFFNILVCLSTSSPSRSQGSPGRCFHKHKSSFWPACRQAGKEVRDRPRIILLKCWSFIPIFIWFIMLCLSSGGVAVGDQALQRLSFHLDNIFFFLFTFFVLFLPDIITFLFVNFKRANLRALSWTIPFFLIYLFLFHASHPWNGPAFDFFIRNRIIHWALANPVNKTLSFIPILLSAIYLFRIKLSVNNALFYCAIFIFLSLSWLAEFRYYLIPITLYLLLKKSSSPKTELIRLGYWTALTILIYYGTLNRLFFL